MSTEHKLRFWLWDLIELGPDIQHFKSIKDAHREVKIFFTARFVVGIVFERGKHVLTRRFARAPHDSLLGFEYKLCSNVDLPIAA